MDQKEFYGKPVKKAFSFLIAVTCVFFLVFLLFLAAKKLEYGYGEYQTLLFRISGVGRIAISVAMALLAIVFGFTAFWIKRKAIISVLLSPEKLIVKRADKTIEMKISEITGITSATNRTRAEGINVSERQSLIIRSKDAAVEIEEGQLNGFYRFRSMLAEYTEPGEKLSKDSEKKWSCADCGEASPVSAWKCKGCGADR